MLRYFISYSYTSGRSAGFANCETHRENELSSIKEIQELSRQLEKEQGYDENSLVIVNFQQFNEGDM